MDLYTTLLLLKISLRICRIIIKTSLLLIVTVINLLFITLFCTLLEQLALGLFPGTINPIYQQYTFLPGVVKSIPLIIVGVYFLYLISPLHFNKLRKKHRFEPLNPEEQQRIDRLLSELKLNRTPTIYRVDDASLNAMTFGFNTIGINRGTLNFATDQELKGIICHEVAHLAHFDYLYDILFCTFQTPGIYCLQAIFRGISWFFRAIAYFLGFFFSAAREVVVLIHNIQLLAVNLFITIFYGGVRIINSNLNKYGEYRCDTYAVRYQCADGLAQFLSRSSADTHLKESIFTRLKNEHPRISKRITRLNKLHDKVLKEAKIA